MTVIITEYTADVQRMLMAVNTAVSPPALVGFLSKSVDPYLRTRAENRFASEGDAAVGGGWTPLTSTTQNIRSSSGYGAAHPINERTGELQQYITQEDARVGADAMGATLTLPGRPPTGELLDKLTHAQAGGVSTSGKPFPARPVIGMDQADLVFVLTSLTSYVNEAGRGALI